MLTREASVGSETQASYKEIPRFDVIMRYVPAQMAGGVMSALQYVTAVLSV